jgi:hypothetical protein
MAFDPDQYLSGGTTTQEFNPDEYLSSKDTFDPDQYLGIKQSPTPETDKAVADTLAVPEGSPEYQARMRHDLGQDVVLPPEIANRPDVAPASTQEAYRKGGILGAAFYPRKATSLLETASGRQLPEAKSVPEQIAKGLATSPLALADFMTTPEGVGYIMAGATGPAIRAVIAGKFGLEGATDTIKALRSGDYHGATQSALVALGSALGLKHDLSAKPSITAPEQPPATSIPPEQQNVSTGVGEAQKGASGTLPPESRSVRSVEVPVGLSPQSAGIGRIPESHQMTTTGSPESAYPNLQAAVALEASKGNPLYVELVDGSRHQVSPFGATVTEGEIALSSGNSVDTRVVSRLLDKNGQPIPIKGGINAEQVTSPESVPQPEIRPLVGEEAPLRQQGETAGTREQGQELAGTPPETNGQMTEPTPVSSPASEPGVGISQARTEAELGEGSVEPGVGAEMGSGLEYGRNYINKGGDPRLPIRRATTSGLVGKNEVGIVHAELERLRAERARAADALERDPENALLQANLEDADTAQREWRKELQPVLTKASDTLREAYAASTPVADPSTYQGLADIFDEHFKGQRDITPEMRTAMAKAARGVREVRDSANGEFAKVEEALGKRMKGKKIMTPDELDADLRSVLEGAFKDCVL